MRLRHILGGRELQWRRQPLHVILKHARQRCRGLNYKIGRAGGVGGAPTILLQDSQLHTQHLSFHGALERRNFFYIMVIHTYFMTISTATFRKCIR